MKRREFLTGSALGAAGGVLVGCGGGQKTEGGPAVVTAKRVRWRVASSFPRGLDAMFGGAEMLASRVSELTDGKFEIRVYPGGELVPGLQVLDAVQQGTVQCGHTASYYYTGKNPALAFDTCVPFGMTSRQQLAWLHELGGLELLRPLFAEFNVMNFPAGTVGTQMGGWFRQKLAGVDSLKGLKMRIPGLGGEVMARLGATVQVLAGGDIYAALERGAIDATEWVGPYDDEKLGFHKVAKYYYYPGWWEPGANLSYYVNTSAWEQLPKAYQHAFVAASQESASWMQRVYDARNPMALKRLVDSGTELVPFEAEILSAARLASTELLEEKAAANASYKKVYDHWKGARDSMNSWFATAEYSYLAHLHRG